MPNSLGILKGDTVISVGGVNSSITANAGGGNTNATTFTTQFTRIGTSANSLSSVILPSTAVIGTVYTIQNAGAKEAAVFPDAGGAIDGLGADAAYPLAAGSVQMFLRETATQFRTLNRALRYVSRGDSSAWDLQQGSMTMDNSWVNWDLTSIIPSAAYGKPIHFRLNMTDNTAGATLSLRTDGYSNAIDVLRLHAQVASVATSVTGHITCSSAGIVEYSASEALTSANLVVLGWWVEG